MLDNQAYKAITVKFQSAIIVEMDFSIVKCFSCKTSLSNFINNQDQDLYRLDLGLDIMGIKKLEYTKPKTVQNFTLL